MNELKKMKCCAGIKGQPLLGATKISHWGTSNKWVFDFKKSQATIRTIVVALRPVAAALRQLCATAQHGSNRYPPEPWE